MSVDEVLKLKEIYLGCMEAGNINPGNIIASAPPDQLYRLDDGIAIIPISGYLLEAVPKWMTQMEIAATAYLWVSKAAEKAATDTRVKRIHLAVNSPGGMVAGVKGAADAIFNARQFKPTTAHVEYLCTSAAYWLTSQAEIISAESNCLIGGIGVYTYFVDTSKAQEKEGIEVLVVRSGEHKGMGLDKITNKQVAAVQQYIDATAEIVIQDVAAGRGVSEGQIAEHATGQVWIAAAAQARGLIDIVDQRS